MSTNAVKILNEKKSDLEDRLDEAKRVVNMIKADIESINRAIYICSPNYKLEVVGAKKSKGRIFKSLEFKDLVFGFLKEQKGLVDTDTIVSFLQERKSIEFSKDYTKQEFASTIVKNLLYYSNRNVLYVERDAFGTPCKWGISG